MKKLSIIIPVYNEEKTIKQILEKLAKTKLQVEKEVIIVDDGSSDSTAYLIEQTTKKFKNTKFIKHPKNKGKGSAIRSAIPHVTGDYILIQDADLEYDPSQINILLDPIKNKQTEVVYGTRLKRLPHLNQEERHHVFLLHYFGNRILSLITSVLYGQWLTDIETGYKLFPSKALENIKLKSKSFEIEPEITTKLLKKGYKIKEVVITTNPRTHNEGKKLHAFKDGKIALWTLIKYRFTN